MKNILITGGAGFIGSNLAIKLKSKGYNVTILDNLSEQIHGINPIETSSLYQSVSKEVKFIKGSVTSIKDWKKALKGQDAVVHLAAETGTGQSMYNIRRYSDVNIGGTALMLDLLTNSKHSVEKVIIASSRAIYGEGKYLCKEHGIVYPLARKDEDMQKWDFECKCPICSRTVEVLPTCEDSKIHPTSIYGITKQTQEQMVQVTGKAIGLPTVAFRYQNVYGPGQSLSNPYTGILSIFSTQIKNGNRINIFEDGRETRDFVYIDDVIDATILGLEKEEANHQVFNVGCSVSVNVLEVANTLISNYQSDSDYYISNNYRLGDIRHNFADISKIRDLIGFNPQVNFQKGIRLFSNWVNKQELKEDKFLKSIDELRKKGLFK